MIPTCVSVHSKFSHIYRRVFFFFFLIWFAKACPPHSPPLLPSAESIPPPTALASCETGWGQDLSVGILCSIYGLLWFSKMHFLALFVEPVGNQGRLLLKGFAVTPPPPGDLPAAGPNLAGGYIIGPSQSLGPGGGGRLLAGLARGL